MPTEKTTADVWITKYALTKGIYKEDGCDVWTSGDTTYVRGSAWNSFRLGTEAFTDKDAAIANAKKRQANKIASLKKQIAKVQAMKFE